MNFPLYLVGVLTLFATLLLASPIINQGNSTVSQSDETEKVPISFNDVIVTGLGTRGFSGTWISGNRIMYREDGAIKVMDMNSKYPENVLTAEQIAQLAVSGFSVSPSWSKILLRYDDRAIFRHSIVAKYALIDDPETAILKPIANGAELSTCVWALKMDKLAFVRNNDVYVRDEQDVERRLTTDGVPGEIYNGVADWVYEEEIMSSSAAIWFSPDGNKLAMVKFVDTNVEEYTYYQYGVPGEIANQYPEAIKLRYPKSGTTNPTVTVQMIDLTDTSASWKVIQPPAVLANEEPIIGSVVWSTDNELVTFWMNRRQNKAIVLKCTFDSLTCEEVITFEEPDGWVLNSKPQCTADGRSCVFIAADNKWFKAIQVDMVEKTKKPLTPNEITVQSIYGFDATNDRVFYLGVPFANPEQRHVYMNDVCLSCDVEDVNGVKCTYAAASFSVNFNYMTLTCSGPTPSYTRIIQTLSKELVISREENVAARAKLATLQAPTVHYLTVDVDGGFQATVRMKVPAELDITATSFDKKYPMLVTVYAGPNSVRAVDGFSFAYQDYLVSSRKVIDVSIDARGCANKGTDMLFSVNNKLGSFEVEDQIDVAKKLQERYAFIDAERSGIWGWSYGGYATAMALAKDTNRVFQCGISVAPVTSWIYYDTMYTERYMSTPQQNPAMYDAGDVTKNLESFKVHDFLLIHGNADDNVHFQQSMALARALQKEDIYFEQMSYPDEAHSLNGVSKHLYHTMDQFWEKCLSLEDE